MCLKALYFPVVLQPVVFFIYNFYLQFQELLTGVTASASSPLLKEVYDSFIHQETSMEGNGQITLGVERAPSSGQELSNGVYYCSQKL